MKKKLRLLVLILCVGAMRLAAQTLDVTATCAEVDFSKKLQTWDGFGVNYVETAQTRDYRTKLEDYGGFGLMTEEQRRDVLEKTFGEDGLKPGLVKMFIDPFHEGYTKKGNDNDNPRVINLAGFDHATTTQWMRHFAREGLALTRARGGNLKFIVTLYGPAPWMTKQKFVCGRDLDPAEKYECAEYLISWAKYLRDVEKLPVKYVSLHNEGEAANRWIADGSKASSPKYDHNMYWPTEQVVDFLRFMRQMLDEQGMQDVGLTPGETSSWHVFTTGRYAAAIADDPIALKNLGLITSHDFDPKPLLTWAKGVGMIRAKRPELHAWTTSMSWRSMDAAFIENIRFQIYGMKVNAVIPWATIQRFGLWVGGDPNAGTAFHVDDKGNVVITPGYYFFKQVCRAGQPGMAVASVQSSDSTVKIIAFARNGTEHPDAFVIINSSGNAAPLAVRVLGSNSPHFRAWRTSPSEQYTDAGLFKLTNGLLGVTSPAGSVTTFFATTL